MTAYDFEIADKLKQFYTERAMWDQELIDHQKKNAPVVSRGESPAGAKSALPLLASV